MRAILGEYAEANPDKEWILGGGWTMSAFPGGTPRAEDLDHLGRAQDPDRRLRVGAERDQEDLLDGERRADRRAPAVDAGRSARAGGMDALLE